MKKQIILTFLCVLLFSTISKATVQEEIERLYEKKDRLHLEIQNLQREQREKPEQQMEKASVHPSTISEVEDVLSPIYITGFTKDTLNDLLEGTGLEGLGASFQKAEEEYQVNSIFLISVAGLESGFGTSRLAKEKNNLFGYNANDKNPYGDASTFATKEESILLVAKKLKENYLSPNGKYFYGCSVEGINVYYCTSSDWAGKIKKLMIHLYHKI